MLKLTVLEYFADMDVVHVHYAGQVCPNLDYPGALAKHLVTSAEVLQNRPHRLFYVVPRFGVMPLNDPISFKLFFEWLNRNVNQMYAVIINSTTTDLIKVVKLYVNKMSTVDVDQTEHFKRTLAKPFSHRPVEPETGPPESQNSTRSHDGKSGSRSSKLMDSARKSHLM